MSRWASACTLQPSPRGVYALPHAGTPPPRPANSAGDSTSTQREQREWKSSPMLCALRDSGYADDEPRSLRTRPRRSSKRGLLAAARCQLYCVREYDASVAIRTGVAVFRSGVERLSYERHASVERARSIRSYEALPRRITEHSPQPDARAMLLLRIRRTSRI